MKKWLKYIFRPTRCIICLDKIKPNDVTGTVKYRYDEDGESKISSGSICPDCLKVMEDNTPDTESVGEYGDEAI